MVPGHSTWRYVGRQVHEHPLFILSVNTQRSQSSWQPTTGDCSTSHNTNIVNKHHFNMFLESHSVRVSHSWNLQGRCWSLSFLLQKVKSKLALKTYILGQTWAIYSGIQIHVWLLDMMLSPSVCWAVKYNESKNSNANWPAKHYKSAHLQ